MLSQEEIVVRMSEDLADAAYYNLPQVWMQYDEEGEPIEENRVVFDSDRKVLHSDLVLAAMLQDQALEGSAGHVVVRVDVEPRRALVWSGKTRRTIYFHPDGTQDEKDGMFSGRAEDRAETQSAEDGTRVGHLVPGGEEMDEEARRGFAEGFDILTACLEAQADRGELDDSLVPFLAVPEHDQHDSYAAVVDFSEDAPLDFSGTVFHIPLSHDFPMGETLRRYIDMVDQAPFEASTILLPAGRAENEISCFFFSYDRRNSAVGLVRFQLHFEDGQWRPLSIEFFDADRLVDIIVSGD